MGVNLEKGGPCREMLAGSEQLVSCSDNEDNNYEDLSLEFNTGGQPWVRVPSWFTHAAMYRGQQVPHMNSAH